MAIHNTTIAGGHKLLFSNLPTTDTHPTLLIKAHGVQQSIFSSFKKKRELELSFYTPSGTELAYRAQVDSMIEAQLLNITDSSETHAYGTTSTIRNHDLCDITKPPLDDRGNPIPGLAFISEILTTKVMERVEQTYQTVLHNPIIEKAYGSSFDGKNHPVNLFNSMPSLLLITADTDLYTILNTRGLEKYRRILCSFCRGSSWNPFSSKKHFITTRKHLR